MAPASPGGNYASSNSGLVVATAIASTVVALAGGAQLYRFWRAREQHESRFHWVKAEIDAQHATEEEEDEHEVLPSIIAHFSGLKLDYGATVEEANKKRTTKYYELTRAAHNYDLVPAVRSYPRLRNRREAEVKRIYRYRGENKSHRTVIVMCDKVTGELLCEARDAILKPLNYSHHRATPGCWIPKESLLHEQDLHVTIAIPWWWHGIREGNMALSQELVARFRQALVLEFHHAFQIELERIVLLGGQTLVALWRTVGSRSDPDDFLIFDRHGEGQDPVVKLRRDIVKCFTSEEPNNWGQMPLTYTSRYHLPSPMKGANHNSNSDQKPAPEKPKPENPTSGRPKLKRSNTIELKSPGLGNHDGFIHTTLARLPIDCLSMSDVELEPIHRLCREATATYCGHRMVVSKFRFIETTGEGGESNPCIAPIFEEYVETPTRVEIGAGGMIEHNTDLHTEKMVDRSATIGNLPPLEKKMSLDGLFDVPVAGGAGTESGGVKIQEIESAVKLTGLAHPLQF